MTKIALVSPVTVKIARDGVDRDEPIDEIELRDPTLGDLRDLSTRITADGMVILNNDVFVLAKRCLVSPAATGVIDRIDARSFGDLLAWYSDFLGGGQATGG